MAAALQIAIRIGSVPRVGSVAERRTYWGMEQPLARLDRCLLEELMRVLMADGRRSRYLSLSLVQGFQSVPRNRIPFAC